jgi:hypothetical protein
MLEGGALNSDEFAAFAKTCIPFCHITSRVEKDPDQDLLQKKGGRGFPHIVAMDADGNVLAEHEGPPTVAGFTQTMAKAQTFIDLKKKAAGGDKAAQVELLLLQAERGHLPPEEIRKRMGQVALTDAQKAKIEGYLADADIRAVLETVNASPATQQAAGRKFLEMRKAGKPAPTGDQEAFAYWLLIMTFAESDKNTAAYEEALGALKTKLAGNPNAKKFLDDKEAVLKRLKEAAGK